MNQQEALKVFIQLTGKINDKGQLEVVLPKGLSPGEVQVTIEAPSGSSWEEQPWTDEELVDLMKVNPRTGAEIVEWLEQQESTGWGNINMTGAEWVQEQRRKHQRKFPKW